MIDGPVKTIFKNHREAINFIENCDQQQNCSKWYDMVDKKTPGGVFLL